MSLIMLIPVESSENVFFQMYKVDESEIWMLAKTVIIPSLDNPVFYNREKNLHPKWEKLENYFIAKNKEFTRRDY